MTAKSAALTGVGLLLALLVASAGPALAAGYDLPGYGRLRFAMTTSQVARMYPAMKRIQAGHYDLKSLLKWVGRTWRTVAVFKGDKLSAVMVLTGYDPAHFRQVVAAARKDLGRPGVYQKKLLYWRQSRRVIVLGWSRVGGRPMTFMRFMPVRKTAAKPTTPRKTTPRPRPTPAPGQKPVTAVFRAKGEYQVCRGEVPYRYCYTRSVYGAGRTAALAIVSCNSHLTSMLTYSSIGSSRAYLTRYCRVIK